MYVSPESRLADFFLPVMRQARTYFAQETDAASARDALIAALDQAGAQARDQGHGVDEVATALFAMVAWMDESAMTSAWTAAASWRLTPLQRHYFGTTRAGTEFYQRLQALPDQAIQVREIYGLVLVAGFRGEYAARSPGEFEAWRTQLLERIRQEQGMAGCGAGQALFPLAGPGPQEPVRPTSALRTRPSWYVLTLILAPILMLLALYGYLDYTLAEMAGALVAGH